MPSRASAARGGHAATWAQQVTRHGVRRWDGVAQNSGKRTHEWDRARRRHLRLLGWETVEVTDDQVTRQAAATAHELRELYDLRRSDLGLASPTATGRGEGRRTRAAG